MVSASTVVVRPVSRFTGRNGLVDKYFYFAMSLVIASVVVSGFSKTVGASLFHPAIPKPLILWFHGGAFSAWVVFYILQSLLVRIGKVSWHRFLGWFGATLAVAMVGLGFATSVVMARFDVRYLQQPVADAEAFLSVPFYGMIAFSVMVGLAIYWRKKPELHRRLLLIATCGLTDAAFGRWIYRFDHNLFYPCLDGLILLGVGHDLLVNKRVHQVYLFAFPSLIAAQGISIYLWRGAPSWWLHFGRSHLGV